MRECNHNTVQMHLSRDEMVVGLSVIKTACLRFVEWHNIHTNRAIKLLVDVQFNSRGMFDIDRPKEDIEALIRSDILHNVPHDSLERWCSKPFKESVKRARQLIAASELSEDSAVMVVDYVFASQISTWLDLDMDDSTYDTP